MRDFWYLGMVQTSKPAKTEPVATTACRFHYRLLGHWYMRRTVERNLQGIILSLPTAHCVTVPIAAYVFFIDGYEE